jgi:hypothetical protein
MNVPVIDMPAEVAANCYQDYRLNVEGNPKATKEDKAIMLGYKALASGRSLIDARYALQLGGLNGNGTPKLAICPAHWAWCYFRKTWPRSFRFQVTDNHVPSKWRRRYMEFPEDIFASKLAERMHKAMVPLIPPSIRPKTALEKYHILWEAAWEAVPGDPMLLRHLEGDLYLVLAAWDLTPVERAVLHGRL